MRNLQVAKCRSIIYLHSTCIDFSIQGNFIVEMAQGKVSKRRSKALPATFNSQFAWFSFNRPSLIKKDSRKLLIDKVFIFPQF